jgi:hypothetical protein
MPRGRHAETRPTPDCESPHGHGCGALSSTDRQHGVTTRRRDLDEVTPAAPHVQDVLRRWPDPGEDPAVLVHLRLFDRHLLAVPPRARIRHHAVGVRLVKLQGVFVVACHVLSRAVQRVLARQDSQPRPDPVQEGKPLERRELVSIALGEKGETLADRRNATCAKSLT